MQAGTSTDEERQAVVRFLAAVIREAEYAADLVGRFLEAQELKRPKPVAELSEETGDVDSPKILRAKRFLLNLGAALRIAGWERAGLRGGLPADLPAASEAFRNLVPTAGSERPSNPGLSTDLSAKVFRTWVERFSRSSRTDLAVDMLLPLRSIPEEELLDALADLLWKHRHLSNSEANRNGDG